MTPEEQQAYEKGFKDAQKKAASIAEQIMVTPYRGHFFSVVTAEMILDEIEKISATSNNVDNNEKSRK